MRSLSEYRPITATCLLSIQKGLGTELSEPPALFNLVPTMIKARIQLFLTFEFADDDKNPLRADPILAGEY